MKKSEIKEMIRRIVQEKKLTAAEKKKKEQIVKGMKKSFKGDEASMYAIATAKAKKIAEASSKVGLTAKNQDEISALSPEQKKKLYDELADAVTGVNDKDFKTRAEYAKAMKDAKTKVYKKYITLNEVQGTELTSKIFDVGSTLKKIEAAMDFGMDQDPQVINGLDQAYAELINVLSIIEKDREENKFVNENEDHEVSMAVNSLEAIVGAAIELRKKLGNQERNIPGWVQDHIAKAENYIEQAAQGFHEVSEEKDPLDVVVAEKKGKDQDGDGDVDSEDWKIGRDIAIKAQMAKKIKESAGGTLDFASGKLKDETPKEGETYLKNLKAGDKFSIKNIDYIVVKPIEGGANVSYADGTGNMDFRGNAIVKKK